MSIKDVVRREEEEEPRNPVGAILALAAFVLGIIVLPKYVASREKKRYGR